MPIKWVPLHEPLERRLQTLAIVSYVFYCLGSSTLCMIFIIYTLFYTRFWWTAAIYLAWLVYDRKIPSRGGRRMKFWRNGTFWRYFANYFPINLVRTNELSPENNYIIGSHPHGILSTGAFCNFCTEATGFSQKFPGIKPFICTLNGLFWIPIIREFNLFGGTISSGKESIEYVLNNSTGNAIAIVIGGAEEALESHPDKYNLKLSGRNGFVKLALKHGAHLVPMYNFGENKIWEQVRNERGTNLRAFQEKFKQLFMFSPPLFFGRGIFQYSFGLIPFRAPITSVVGKPIKVKQNLLPTEEDIEKLHDEYCKQLIKLFDEHKTEYGISKNAKLDIY